MLNYDVSTQVETSIIPDFGLRSIRGRLDTGEVRSFLGQGYAILAHGRTQCQITYAILPQS